MGHFKDLLLPRSSRTSEIGHCLRKRGIQSRGTKHLWCTPNLTRRSPQGDNKIEHYHPGNVDSELPAGRTGARQFSTYQFQLSSHSTIGTYNCDNELHVITAQDIVMEKNETNKDQEGVFTVGYTGVI